MSDLLMSLLLIIGAMPAGAQTNDTWKADAGGDWSDLANWLNGMPPNDGGVATFPDVLSNIANINLDIPVELSGLVFDSAYTINLNPTTGSLTFANGVDTATIDNTHGAHALGAFTLNSNLAINNTSETLTFGGVISGPGGLINNSGFTVLNANNTYAGQTVIQGGRIDVATDAGLGAGTDTEADGTIVKSGGVLRLGPGVDMTHEMLILENGGELSSTTGSGTENVFTNEIKLVGSGVINPQGTRSLLFKGVISGDGDLIIKRANYGIFFNDNTYTGKTTLSNVNLTVLTSNGLGTTDQGTELISGYLFQEVHTDEDFTVHARGTLMLGGSDTPYTNELIFFGGTLGGDRPPSSPNLVDIQSQVHAIGAITLNNVNSGGVTTQISGGLDVQGDLIRLGANGQIILNSAATISGNVDVGGDLTVRHAYDAPGALTILGGFARFEVDQSVADLRITFNSTYYLSSADLPELQTGNGAVLTVLAPEIELETAIDIDADIAGVQVIHKRSGNRLVASNIGASNDARIDVEAGQYNVAGATGLGSTVGETFVVGNLGDVAINAGVSTAENFHIENANGLGLAGALRGFSNGATVTGNIELGDGATVGAGLTIAGTISGGTLEFSSHDTRTFTFVDALIASSGHTYTGLTRLNAVNLFLINNGALASTAGVFVGRNSLFVLDNSGTANLTDRLADDVPVQMAFGTLEIRSAVGGSSSETIGEVDLLQSRNTIKATLSGGGTGADLTLGNLVRSAGATADFRTTPASGARIFLPGVTLNDGLVGGWAVVSDKKDFATLTANGVEPLSTTGRASQINGAAADANVRTTVALNPLTADQSINSLVVDSTSAIDVDLGGHLLNVASGGILNAGTGSPNHSYFNGSLTAGGSTPDAELFIHANVVKLNIAANIVDNPGGAVALVAGGSGTVKLSGTNTYTGATYVNTTLEIANINAIAPGSPLYLAGTYKVLDTGGGVLPLDEVHLIGGTFSSASGTWKYDPQGLIAESGTLAVALTGNADIIKTTRGRLLISGVNTSYSGNIDVQEGILSVGGTAVLGSGVTTIHDGAQLNLYSSTAGGNIDLAGGIVYLQNTGLSWSGSLHVSAESTFVGYQPDVYPMRIAATNLLANLSGDGNLHIDALTGTVSLKGDNADYTGAMIVESGTLINASLDTGMGSIVVKHGGAYQETAATSRVIHLDGGVASGSAMSSHVVAEAGAGLGVQTFTGTLDINDGVQLLTYNTINETISGRVNVRGHTAMRGLSTTVTLNGLIASDAPDAVLDLRVSDVFSLSASYLVHDGQSLTILRDGQTATLAVSGAGKSVGGAGAIHDSVALKNNAALNPGNSPGTLMIDGALTMDTTVTTTMEFAADGAHDRVDVSGDVALAGHLNLLLDADFSPVAGQVFPLLTYEGNRTGRFTFATGPGLIDQLAMLLLYDDDPGGVTGEVVARATLLGDANVDGKVDISDLVLLAKNFGALGSMDWFDGDFNFDGTVDISDLVLLSKNFDLTDPPAASLMISVGNVPEPATLGLLFAGLASMGRSARRQVRRK
ncbi:MAG: PEP-CTERM sorting domain-containing protein [Planctomycetes bacterium]|nr:PEP-CTERM sorting domain-containing protein [Planctomycetota bacterium]